MKNFKNEIFVQIRVQCQNCLNVEEIIHDSINKFEIIFKNIYVQ